MHRPTRRGARSGAAITADAARQPRAQRRDRAARRLVRGQRAAKASGRTAARRGPARDDIPLERFASRCTAAALAALPRALPAPATAGEMRADIRSARPGCAGAAGGFALLSRELVDVARASYTARRDIGTVDGLFHEEKGGRSMDTILQDIRYRARARCGGSPASPRSPSVTMGLGIGASTAVFTVVNGVLLRPLASGRPRSARDRLVHGGRDAFVAWPLAAELPATSRPKAARSPASAAFAPATAESHGPRANLSASRAQTSRGISSRVLGDVHVRHGRAFLAADARGGASGVVILSDRLWRRQFGGQRGHRRIDDAAWTASP